MSHLWHYTSTTPKHESLWHNASRRREYPELSKIGLDFVVGIGDALEPSDGGQDVPLAAHTQGRDIPRDRRSGVPVLPTAERIREHFAGSGAVLIVVDTRYVDTGVVERSLVQYLWDEAEELCQGGCGVTRAFLWRFEAPEPNHRPDER